MERHPIERFLEWIVVRPLRATIIVGLGTLFLQGMTTFISAYWSVAHFFHFIVPFVPPYFITRTAQRIREHRPENAVS